MLTSLGDAAAIQRGTRSRDCKLPLNSVTRKQWSRVYARFTDRVNDYRG
jgi:hypothetical protein